MVRTARERVDDLFGLANVEGTKGAYELADRYVELARRVGTRHNVRIPREYRELYCRQCSAFWSEGRTVRTRLRAGHRIRTCLVCGAIRRQSFLGPSSGVSPVDVTTRWTKGPEEVLAEEPSDLDEEASDIGSEEDE